MMPARPAPVAPVASLTWEQLVERADALAATDVGLRFVLAEVRESRWCTRVFQGSSRAPSMAELRRAVERASSK